MAEEWKANLVLFADVRDDDNPTVGIVRFLPDEIRVYGPEPFAGPVLVALGVRLPPAVAGLAGEIAIYPSAEQIGRADADILFLTAYGDPAQTSAPAVQGGPIWPTLLAVAAGRAYEVSDDTGMLGIGVLGADAILADIEGALLG